MRSAYYRVRDEDNRERHYLVVYDESKPCAMCGLPIGDLASVSATAICGPCDSGKPRIPEWQIRNRLKGKQITPAEAWGNKAQDFLFDTRDEADHKMFELHQEGVTGWPHVIERVGRTNHENLNRELY